MSENAKIKPSKNNLRFLQVELGEVASHDIQDTPAVSSTSARSWPAELVISIASSLLCFPPLGVLHFIKYRQVR
jgi:hypothetical protein